MLHSKTSEGTPNNTPTHFHRPIQSRLAGSHEGAEDGVELEGDADGVAQVQHGVAPVRGNEQHIAFLLHAHRDLFLGVGGEDGGLLGEPVEGGSHGVMGAVRGLEEPELATEGDHIVRVLVEVTRGAGSRRTQKVLRPRLGHDGGGSSREARSAERRRAQVRVRRVQARDERARGGVQERRRLRGELVQAVKDRVRGSRMVEDVLGG